MPQRDKPSHEPIAIVGMACLFPNAPGLKEYWRLIRCGLDGITDVPPTHWSPDDYFDADPKAPDMTYCRRGGFLGVTAFDPSEFGIPPAVLEATDTSQLLALLVAKRALDDAGYGEKPTADSRQPKTDVSNPALGTGHWAPGTGHSPSADRSRISVMLGVTGTQELVIPLGARLGHPIWKRALRDEGITGPRAEQVLRRIADGYVSWQENSFPGLLGNVVAGRIANRLNLGGTNCVVDAACASSLSAIHLAMMELQTGRCDVALSGGVDALNDIFMHMCFSKTPALSLTGDVRPFSSDADGTVLGEGIGIVVLKRLSDAQRDGDRIYAAIRAVGTSSDGRQNSIYAPNATGQAVALRRAYQEANVDPRTIELVEAHGTGTKVGDVVEFESLRTVYAEVTSEEEVPSAECRVPSETAGVPSSQFLVPRESTEVVQASGLKPQASRTPWCAVGSVKSQIGHTKAAAGVAGLIKAALALHHRVLPPTLKVREPNAKLRIEGSPLYLNTEARPWTTSPDHPRRAAVSSFGFGGSNFHLVLEENSESKIDIPARRAVSARPHPAWDASVEIIALSAKTPAALISTLTDWKSLLADAATWSHVAHQAARSRAAFSSKHDFRLLIIIERPAQQGTPAGQAIDPAIAELRRLIEQAAEELARNAATPWNLPGVHFGVGSPPGKLAMLFPGQGSQRLGMARDLSTIFPELNTALANANVRDAIYPPRAFNDADRAALESALTQTDTAQPALGAISVGMLQILTRFGVQPAAAAGHSFGELVALHAAGRFDAAPLHRLARRRGAVMASANGEDRGTMLAVTAPLADIEQLVISSKIDVVLANHNAPTQGVISGPREAVRQANELCRQRGWPTQPLPVAAAFHSRLMVDAQAAFRRELKTITFAPARIPVFANTTGSAYPDDATAARDLLAGQIASPVRFVQQISGLYDAGVRVFLEVGPRTVLTVLARSTLADRPAHLLAVDSSAGQRSGLLDLARVLAQLAALGMNVDLSAWEEPTHEPAKPRMSVPLVGANYRAPRAAIPPTAPSLDKTETPAALPRPATVGENYTVNHSSPTPDYAPAVDGGALVEALRVVQDGLHAMQQLQQQTAQAHQRFLEGQTVAHQTFQSMMAGQQRLLERALGMPVSEIALPAAPHRAAPPVIAPVATAQAVAPMPTAQRPVERPAMRPVNRFAQPAAPRDDLEHAVLCVVSEKTGYPLDQLASHLHLDDDLGIDPIRRSEIAEAVIDRRGRAVQPDGDRLMRLTTVGDLVEWIRASEIVNTRPDTGRLAAPARMEPSAPVAPARISNPQPAIRNPQSPPARTGASPTTDTFAPALLAVVSELTGYPLEMLALDMDMESDLGIDSIKRVEILAAVQERVPGATAVNPEYMGSLRTLRQIVDYSTGGNGAAAMVGSATATIADSGGPPRPFDAAPTARASKLDRRVLGANDLPHAVETGLKIAANHEVWIVSDKTPLADEVAQHLKKRGLAARVVDMREHPTPRDGQPVGGLVFLASTKTYQSRDREGAGTVPLKKAFTMARSPLPHGRGSDIQSTSQSHSEAVALESLWSVESENYLKAVFAFTRSAAANLRSAAKAGGALLTTVARMDGALGLTGGPFDAAHGALAGLAKTASHEWPGVRCRALDVDANWNDDAAVAESIVRELMCDGPLEVGLHAKGRRGLTLTPRAVEPSTSTATLSANDVVLITGGARGVTAEAALALTRAFQPRIILLGRSPAPTREPAWLADAREAADMKRAILNNEFASQATPAQVESSYRRHVAAREITRTLEQIRATGATVEYASLDVRDTQTVTATVRDITSRVGPITALIHGAGVLEDKRIEDKTDAQFGAVFDTKVIGLRNLLAAIDAAKLRHLLLFSSVTARLGRQGQSDYAMANELLNKAAHRFAAAHPHCRVASLNWGPWEGGMVTPSLRREFERQGVSLIPLADGAQAVVDEITSADSIAIEVVRGASWSEPSFTNTTTATAAPRILFRRDLDMAGHAFLESHQIAGKPVLPVAIIAEWLAHAAQLAHPTMRFVGIDDLRILRGVILKTDRYPLSITQRGESRDGATLAFDLELFGEGNTPHARGRVLVSTDLPAVPSHAISANLAHRPFPHDINHIYREILFHGPAFQAIEKIIGHGEAGLIAQLRTAPPPRDWMTAPPRDRWITDPLILDAGFQLGIVWCRAHLGAPSLPAYGARYCQYRTAFPTGPITAALEVRHSASHRMTADITYLDQAGAVIARVEGCEWTVDASLAAAFRSPAPAGAGS